MIDDQKALLFYDIQSFCNQLKAGKGLHILPILALSVKYKKK